MIYNLLASKHCPSGVRDPRILKWEFTLPELLELREYVDVMEAFDYAINKDNEPPKKP